MRTETIADRVAAGMGIAAMVALSGIGFAAWLTHVVVCLKAGAWGFLIAGGVFFPIAIVHGIGIWFGAW